MASGGRCRRRRSWIRRHRRGGSKLEGCGGGNDDAPNKLGSCSSGEWISVRGHRIKLRGRMRVDGNGDIYIPDSEDEEPAVEVEAGDVEVANLGGALVAANGLQIGDGVKSDGLDLATESVPADAVKVATEVDAVGGIKVAPDMATDEEMHPEVAARLKKALAHMDPTFHDLFVSMYKVMVPAFFKP
ncbi:hypothetical protein HU200_036438 [Digitaria exilis]|uniref:Uncharacterized protein n=1 Tax=Digitaria exilis TaxID=1010633 RepID=A0A835BG00_9POAL|nr:hypothetical protein HU200_036438 [Digitaria exilis]